MKQQTKRLIRNYHSFYTPSLCENIQEQSSKETLCQMRLPPFNPAPGTYCPYIENCHQDPRSICSSSFEKCTIYLRTKVLTRLKSKTGLERFIERYGESWREMFIGSRK